MRLLPLLICAGVFVAALSGQQKFDPRDLSGHWDRMSPIVSFSNVPGSGRGATVEAPFTPEGKKMNDANKPGYGPRRGTTRNDPLGRCEPLGLVRHLSTEIVEPHNTFEIVQLPNRILQFFEYRHDWREIWMDGRALGGQVRLPALGGDAPPGALPPSRRGHARARDNDHRPGRLLEAVVERRQVDEAESRQSEALGRADLLRPVRGVPVPAADSVGERDRAVGYCRDPVSRAMDMTRPRRDKRVVGSWCGRKSERGGGVRFGCGGR